MKRNPSNFTRGSQLIGHFGFMFAAGLKGPVLVALGTLAGVAWWKVNAALSAHEVYLVWMRVYAALWTFMEFYATKPIALERGDGGTIEVTVATLAGFAPVAAAWTKFLGALRSAAWLSAIDLAPLLIAFTWFAERSATAPSSASTSAARFWFHWAN